MPDQVNLQLRMVLCKRGDLVDEEGGSAVPLGGSDRILLHLLPDGSRCRDREGFESTVPRIVDKALRLTGSRVRRRSEDRGDRVLDDVGDAVEISGLPAY